MRILSLSFVLSVILLLPGCKKTIVEPEASPQETPVKSTKTAARGSTPVSIYSYDTKLGNYAPTSHSLTSVPAGALLVLTTCDESYTDNCTVTSSPSLTWTKQSDVETTNPNAEIWTAVYTAGGSITVNSSWGGGFTYQSSTCYVVINQEATLGGNQATGTNQASPQVNISSTRDNSLLFCVTSDWLARNGSTRTYRGTPTERLYNRYAPACTMYHYYDEAPTVGSYTMGLTTPNNMGSGTCVLEIRGEEPTDDRENLLLTADAEDSNALPWPFDVYGGADANSITKSTTFIGSGTKSYKFVVNKTDDEFAGGIRAELNSYGGTSGGYSDYERWVGFKILIPTSWRFEDSSEYITNCMSQFHDNTFEITGETEQKSAFEFAIANNKFSYAIRANAGETNLTLLETLADESRMELYNPSIIKGNWYDIVIHVKFEDPHSTNPNKEQARVEIWINGTKATDYTGYMGYHHTNPPFFKIGNYCWYWNDENMEDSGSYVHDTSKTHYVDDIRVGDENATYADVAP